MDELETFLKDTLEVQGLKYTAQEDRPKVTLGVTKFCNACEIVKPVEEFYLRQDKVYTPGYGYTSKCKDCSKEKTRDYWKRYRKAPIGSCVICNKVELLVKDHCHASGMNRGMLCQSCNKGLGLFRDNTEFLTKAIVYLKRYGAV